MNKKYEILFGICLICALLIGTLLIYSTQKVVNKYHYENEINFDPQKFFVEIQNVQNYTKIFPKDVLSVIVINQTNGVVYTKETHIFQGFTKTFEVKHEFNQNQKHIITILTGDLKDSFFVIEIYNKTSHNFLKVDGNLHVPAYLGYSINTTPSGINNFNKIVNMQIQSFIANT